VFVLFPSIVIMIPGLAMVMLTIIRGKLRSRMKSVEVKALLQRKLVSYCTIN
jgi:hypothetical protein